MAPCINISSAPRTTRRQQKRLGRCRMLDARNSAATLVASHGGMTTATHDASGRWEDCTGSNDDATGQQGGAMPSATHTLHALALL